MPLQIRRTQTANAAPTGLLPGQLSVEMASTPPKLWCGVPVGINAQQRVQLNDFVTSQQLTDAVHGTPIYSGPTAPPTPNPGDLWYDTTVLTLKTWNGSAWVTAEPTDVSGFLPLTGGTCTGLIHVQYPGNPAGVQPAAFVSIYGNQVWWMGTAAGAPPNDFQITNHNALATRLSISATTGAVTVYQDFGVGGSATVAGNAWIQGGPLTMGTVAPLSIDVTAPVRQFNWYTGNWSNTFNTGTGLRTWEGPVIGTLMGLDAAGNLSAAGTITPGSDVAFKENIEDYQGAIDIGQLRPRYFNRKAGDGRRELGFVHQELKQVADELAPVSGGIKGLDPIAILAALVTECQQLRARIAELEHHG